MGFTVKVNRASRGRSGDGLLVILPSFLLPRTAWSPALTRGLKIGCIPLVAAAAVVMVVRLFFSAEHMPLRVARRVLYGTGCLFDVIVSACRGCITCNITDLSCIVCLSSFSCTQDDGPETPLCYIVGRLSTPTIACSCKMHSACCRDIFCQIVAQSYANDQTLTVCVRVFSCCDISRLVLHRSF